MSAPSIDLLASRVRVLHEDAEILVLFKPSGIPTTSPDGAGCLAEIARKMDPRSERLHPTSRLDSEVTGIVTFARTERATRALLAMRKEGHYLRTYLGIAAHVPAQQQGKWTASIAIDPRDPRKRVALDARSNVTGYARVQHASTRYEVLAVAQANAAAKLALYPETGRTHQLRVHCAHAGCALAGDVHYGGPRRIVLEDGSVVSAKRTMLHCHRVTLKGAFWHPDTELVIESAEPPDFAQVWQDLH